MTDLRTQLQHTLGTAYTLERELGGGGMSRVFLAQEHALTRDVVVKVIKGDVAEGVSAERFAREVKLAARLQQANIVPVLTAGQAGGLPYYTMPFVKGESLRARIAAGPPLSVTESTSILRDVARALAYAHAEGVVHRDIKPENVLLSGGAAVVTDFGIAKAIHAARTGDGVNDTELTQAGISLGTPAYMAPEQALGDPATDHRADIYAWGVIAYELLAGAHPFAARTTSHALVTAHVSEVPHPLRDARAGIPVVLSALVMRALEKDPTQRPQSASELLSALDTLGTPTSSVPSKTVNRLAGAVRAFVALAAMLTVALVVWFARRPASATATADATFDKSVAVLPFAFAAGDTSNAYLAEGIAEEVSNTLAQVPGLRLAGRRSAARFASKTATVQEIGTALNVSTVLEGTVRRAGDRISVTAELTNAHDGTVLWSQKYDRDARVLYTVQDDIARAIAGQLQVTLTGAGASSAARGTRDAAAYDLYLQGMYLYRRRGGNVTRALALFEQAVARDSTFARAWAALGYGLPVSTYYLNVRMGDVLPRARAAAARAVALDSLLVDSQLAMGTIAAETFDWREAEARYRRAIALAPTSAEAHWRLGWMFSSMGRPADAVTSLQQSKALDPLAWLTLSYLGSMQVAIGQADAGIAEMTRSLELEPDNLPALTMLGDSYATLGRNDSARVIARRLLTLRSLAMRIGRAGGVLARAGAVDEARVAARTLNAMPDTTWTKWTGLVQVYDGLNDVEGVERAITRAAQGDGDLFPGFALALYHRLPNTPVVRAALERYRLDPQNFVRATGK